MPDPALAVQKAFHQRLVATAAVTALVPAGSIIDRNERPAPNPSIILGDDQVVDPGTSIKRNVFRVHSTLHLWKVEEGLTGVKAIARAVSQALKTTRLNFDAGIEFIDCYVSTSRFIRDPDGTTSHGIVTVETLVREVA